MISLHMFIVLSTDLKSKQIIRRPAADVFTRFLRFFFLTLELHTGYIVGKPK